MIEIKDLLKRFQKILFSEEGKKESVRKVLSEAVNLDIKKEEIKIKNGTIYLDIKPIYKNEILLKKDRIDDKLGEIFGKKPDIR